MRRTSRPRLRRWRGAREELGAKALTAAGRPQAAQVAL